MTRFPATLILASGAVTAANAQEVEIAEIEQDRYLVTLTSADPLESAEAQQQIRASAQGLCPNNDELFGRYEVGGDRRRRRSEGNQFVFSQEVHCGSEQAWEPVGVGNSGVVQSDTTQPVEDFVRDISTEYLRNRAAGDFEPAFAALSDELHLLWTLDDWGNSMQAFNDASGSLQSLEIETVSLSDNPQGVSEPGTYFVVEYEAAFERMPLQCGYLIWFEAGENRFVMLREDSKYITTDAPARFTEAQLSQYRAQLGCAG